MSSSSLDGDDETVPIAGDGRASVRPKMCPLQHLIPGADVSTTVTREMTSAADCWCSIHQLRHAAICRVTLQDRGKHSGQDLWSGIGITFQLPHQQNTQLCVLTLHELLPDCFAAEHAACTNLYKATRNAAAAPEDLFYQSNSGLVVMGIRPRHAGKMTALACPAPATVLRSRQRLRILEPPACGVAGSDGWGDIPATLLRADGEDCIVYFVNTASDR